LVVAADHWYRFALDLRHIGMTAYAQLRFNAGYAVLFFYVISGFLITFTLSQNYSSDAAGAARFYRNRAVRIFSLYWPVALIGFATVPGAWHDFLVASSPDKLTGLFLLGTDWRVAFASY